MINNHVSQNELYKTPRLYVDADFALGGAVRLEAGQNHYLRNVLRKREGDALRVFNGRDGEWLARVLTLGKKAGELELEGCLRSQPDPAAAPKVHLYFSPIKKQRMDVMIEKAVELGVSDLRPVIMHRSVMRNINEERMRAQIIEAAEQCERMDIPALEPARQMDEVIAGLSQPLFACIERDGAALPLAECEFGDNVAFLVGPEGGFEEREIAQLQACGNVIPVSLGGNILRAETAAIACLVAFANLKSVVV